jgi:hypothetical protein
LCAVAAKHKPVAPVSRTGLQGEKSAYPTAGLDAGLLEEAASLLEQAAVELKG